MLISLTGVSDKVLLKMAVTERKSAQEEVIKTREHPITQEDMEDIVVSVGITSQSMEPRKRVGNLSDLEREFD